MPRSPDSHPPPRTRLTLRGADDLASLGKFLREHRRRNDVGTARDAAPLLGVGYRLLVELESGTRGKRGVTLGKLLPILEGLGLELVLQPRGRPMRDHADHQLPAGRATSISEPRRMHESARRSARKRQLPARSRKPTSSRGDPS